MKESPGARPVELGATRSFAFYGVSTKRAYFTLLLQTAYGDDRTEMKALDVLPNTPIRLPPK